MNAADVMTCTFRALLVSALSALLLSTCACNPTEAEPADATLDLLKVARCSWPDGMTPHSAFAATRPRVLRWRVVDAEQLPVGGAAVMQAIKQALRKWSVPAGLQFEKSSGAADITIAVGHVDGVGGALSAARVDEEGALITLDIEESWSTDYRPHTYSLHGVVLHEIGHALGLGHSAATSSVMHVTAYGAYREFLTTDDRDAVAELYQGT